MGHEWWRDAVVYQVYPRSFADADGDGLGDLAGIRSRLDHLRWLGVDAVWLSPVFPSPMADGGYDVSDLTGVHPALGTLGDLDGLIADLHALDMRLVLDLVPNHTSDAHPWFVESRASRDAPRRDWYVWRDPAPGGGPPNNWESFFGGSAWTCDPATGQWYLHLFHRRQPDLNWRNPEVEAAIHDVMRFWLARGVDGFRLDVVWMLLKDPLLRDNPANPGWRPGMPWGARQIRRRTEDQPDLVPVLQRLRRVADGFADDRGARLLIGEIYLPPERLGRYYGPRLDGLHLPFNFLLAEAGPDRWTAHWVARVIARYEAALPPGGWGSWVLGNHDQPRIAGRVGPWRSRLAQMLLLTLRGTPTMYYGDELGLPDVRVPPDRGDDPQPPLAGGWTRDWCRTPMPWRPGEGGGFTTGRPWLPLPADPGLTVAVQREDPASHLALVRRLLAVRRATPALRSGDVRLLAAPEGVVAYVRGRGDGRVLVALNLAAAPRPLGPLAGAWGRPAGRVLVATGMDRQGDLDLAGAALAPGEGLVVA